MSQYDVKFEIEHRNYSKADILLSHSLLEAYFHLA